MKRQRSCGCGEMRRLKAASGVLVRDTRATRPMLVKVGAAYAFFFWYRKVCVSREKIDFHGAACGRAVSVLPLSSWAFTYMCHGCVLFCPRHVMCEDTDCCKQQLLFDDRLRLNICLLNVSLTIDI